MKHIQFPHIAYIIRKVATNHFNITPIWLEAKFHILACQIKRTVYKVFNCKHLLEIYSIQGII